jgi:molybdate transport system substrate-binding protein
VRFELFDVVTVTRPPVRGITRCVVLALLLLPPGPALAQAPITVFVGGAMTEPLQEAGEAFTRATGVRIVYVSDTTGVLQKRLAAGEQADLVIVAAPVMDVLVKEQRVAAATRVDLARALIGVGVRAGAASPDLSTADSFKAALLAARSISYVTPAVGGTSGTYIAGLLERMGIADALKAKTVYRTLGSAVADAVAAGEAELGITFTSELQQNAGVTIAGPLPASIQMLTIYAGAVASGAPNRDAAGALLRALAGPAWRETLTRAGLQPLDR